MGLFSSGDAKVEVVDPLAAQKTTAANYLTGILGQTPDIPTRKIAGMTDTEKLGQQILGKYANAELPAEYTMAMNKLSQIINQGGDISQLPEYKAILADSANQTNDAVNQALRRIQISGMSGSTPQGRAVGKAIGEGQTRTAAALAPLASEARSNQLNALNMLSSYINQGQSFDLNKLNAISNFGSLPRQINQEEMDALYNTLYMQKMFPYQYGSNIAGSILGGSIDTAVTPGDPSILNQIAGPLANLAGSYFVGKGLSSKASTATPKT